MIWSQHSFEEHEGGVLYLVPTPIGNLDDITFRALGVLKEVDYIACEDTRQTRKLLTHFEINKKLTAYHHHNRHEKGAQLLADLQQGKRIALVSDAGMPAISDPGEELVQSALKAHIPVISLPGANAGLTGLVASGLPTQPFLFYGFLPRKTKELREELERVGRLPYTLIFYVGPHHLLSTLQEMAKWWPTRQAALGREISKRYEEYVRGTLIEMVRWAKEGTVRGECTLYVAPNESTEHENGDHGSSWWESLSVVDHVRHYIEEGLAPPEALRRTARERRMSRRQVYQIYHGLMEE